MTTEVHLPELGENIEEAEVLKVLVAEGDEVQEGQEVAQLETDKAAFGLPSPSAGRVKTISVGEGDRVKIGSTVLTLEDTGAERAEAPPRPPPPPVTAPRGPEERRAKEPAPPRPAEHPAERPPEAPPRAEAAVSLAAPSVRKLARELGVDLAEIPASDGRVTQEDVKAFVRRLVAGGAPRAAREEARLPDFARWGEIERQPMNGIRRRTAAAVELSWKTIPHVTHFDSADVTELEEARVRHERARNGGDPKEKLTLTALLLKACATPLREFEPVNSSLDAEAEEIVLKRYVHIGVAVDTEHGLLVPVVRDVDKKSVRDIARELNDLAARARERKLALPELQGASFAITNLGGIGGTAFTPIIQHPQAAILGVGAARNEVVPHDGRTATRRVLPLCLSYDHRIVDGAMAARFVRRLGALLADPFELFLEA